MLLTLDQALSSHIGELGKAQIRTILLTSILWVPSGLMVMLLVFAAIDPVTHERWKCVDENDATCTWALSRARKEPSLFCDLEPSQWVWTAPEKSMVNAYGLYCESTWKVQLVNILTFVGCLIGSGSFGFVMDRFGRKKPLYLVCTLASCCTLVCGLVDNYYVLLLARFFTGIGTASVSLGIFVLATEPVGPTWRGTVGICCQLFFVFGELLLCGLAVIFLEWRHLTIACAVCGAITLLSYPFVHESARWLLVKDRKEEARAILEAMARENGNALPSDVVITTTAKSGTTEKIRLYTMLKNLHVLRRFLIVGYTFFILNLGYFGLSLGSGGMSTSVLLTFLLGAVAEIPANLVSVRLIERIGRHNTIAAGLFIGGAGCISCAFVRDKAVRMTLSTLGKFGCTVAQSVLCIYAFEIFPTPVRSSAMGAESLAGRVGSIAAPFIVMVGTALNAAEIPFLVIGGTFLLGALLVVTLPETLGLVLPDTMQDLDQIRSIFTTGRWRAGFRSTVRELFRSRGEQKEKSRMASVLCSVKEEDGSEEGESVLPDDVMATQVEVSVVSMIQKEKNVKEAEEDARGGNE